MTASAIDTDVAVEALDLLPDTHPALRRAISETDISSIDAPGIARVLEVSMAVAGGIGLAANQVGLDVRAFAMRKMDGSIHTVFNPVIEEVEGGPRVNEEQCLSFPGLALDVERQRAVRMSWTDAGGQRREAWMRGLDAICVQHEIDHLDGIVFTMKVSRLVLERARKRLAKERRRDARQQ